MNIKREHAQLVADTANQTVKNVNDLLRSKILLLNTIIDISEQSDISVFDDQPIFDECSITIEGIVKSRKDIGGVIRKLERIRGRSNAKSYNLGCPNYRGSVDFEIEQPYKDYIKNQI